MEGSKQVKIVLLFIVSLSGCGGEPVDGHFERMLEIQRHACIANGFRAKPITERGSGVVRYECIP